MKRLAVIFFSLCTAILMTAGCGTTQPETKEKTVLRLAAAASLEEIMEKELLPAFLQKEKIEVQGVYDGSGRLQRQLEQGLEADIFIAAAPGPVNALVKQELIEKTAVRPLLSNELVLAVPKGNPANVKSFADLPKAAPVAVGDPAVVPAGIYAKNYLTGLGLWQEIEPKATLATSVTQVLAWVAAGNAKAGLMYATDAALSSQVEVIARAEESKGAEKIVYPLAVMKKSKQKAAAERFALYLASEGAGEVFKRYGFTPIKDESKLKAQ